MAPNDACMITPYPAVEEKHIWQVYVTSELRKKDISIFRLYLDPQRIKMNQNEAKSSNATHNQQQRFKTNFSLPCSQSGRFWQSLY